MSVIPTIKDPSVSIEVRSDGADALRCTFKGVLGHRDPGQVLEPFFRDLASALAREQPRKVAFDLTALRFMNSSSFKHFIAFVKKNGAVAPETRARIQFVLNAAFHWQEVSIHALSCFSVEEFAVEKITVPA